MNHPDLTPHDLHLETHGPEAAPRLLLLHGWGSASTHMRPLARALSDTYRTYTVDLPGHGASPPPPTPWGVPEHAALLHMLIDDVIGAPVTIIGHSNGGRLGLYLASTPETADAVARLVLISPSGMTPNRSWDYYARKYAARALKAPLRMLPAAARAPAEDFLRHSLLWKALGSSDYNALSGVMRDTFVKTVTHHLDGPVHRITAPTLIFWGTHDTAISRDQMARLEAAIPDAGLVELEGAGHYGQLDQLETVAAATRYFLEHS
ncbi:alpha/beta fold hydrolase [Salisaeta longa]|uniref:alpha/beta fold hydrolase n=1 Tax=Salisaeta longa TaxID=503170 RepID=UPI00048A812E|nr:alpha/beta hydrolase [Salisaeta longa]